MIKIAFALFFTTLPYLASADEYSNEFKVGYLAGSVMSWNDHRCEGNLGSMDGEYAKSVADKVKEIGQNADVLAGMEDALKGRKADKARGVDPCVMLIGIVPELFHGDPSSLSLD